MVKNTIKLENRHFFSIKAAVKSHSWAKLVKIPNFLFEPEDEARVGLGLSLGGLMTSGCKWRGVVYCGVLCARPVFSSVRLPDDDDEFSIPISKSITGRSVVKIYNYYSYKQIYRYDCIA